MRVAGWCFFAALLINLFCNSFSPFYIPEGAQDPNCFYAEGCALAQGCLPYRDFLDVKGPLLFLIFGIGYLLTPTHCGGIFLLYVLATWGTLTAFYRTAELFGLAPRQAAAAVALAACCLFSRATAFWAAMPEHFLVLPLAWSLYHLAVFLKYPRQASLNSMSWWVGGGATATFLIKYNFTLPYVAIFCVVTLILVKEKRTGDALAFCWRCLVAFCLVCIPFIIYFTYHGLWGDFFHAYFTLNANANSHQAFSSFRHLRAIIGKFTSPCAYLACLVAGHTLYTMFTKRSDAEERKLMWGFMPVFLCTLISCLVGAWGYYYIVMAPTAIFLCTSIAGSPFVGKLLQRGLVWTAIAYFIVFTLFVNGFCLSSLGWGRPSAERQKVKEIQELIACVPKPTIVYYGCPDILLGRKAAAIPGAAPWMVLFGIGDDEYAPRDCAIREGRVDFVVTAWGLSAPLKSLLEGSGYEQIPEARLEEIGAMYKVQVWASTKARLQLRRATNP